MSCNFMHIDKAVLRSYPNTKIGVIVANFSASPKDISMPRPESFKNALEEKGIHASTYAEFPNIKIWRSLFKEDFNINPKVYRPSIDSLAIRAIRGKGLPSILPLVNLYNICSLEYLLPMGGYDLDKISNHLVLRYGREGETFVPLHAKTPSPVQSKEIVYADDKRVVCWLWNYKDTMETSITKETRRVLFCVDSLDETTAVSLDPAMKMLIEGLQNMGGFIEKTAVLSKENHTIFFKKEKTDDLS